MNTQTTMTRDAAETRAQQVFYVHAALFVGVNAFLTYIDLTNDPSSTWFYWPLAGWGAGLIAHGIGVFVTHKAADRVQERVARREARREAHREKRESRAHARN